MPPKTKGDYAFILHMIETHEARDRPHGRRRAARRAVPRRRPKARIRQKLIEENLLDAVIGLPEKLFYGTGIPAAILVFRKNKTDDKVLFIDASRDYEEGTSQNLLREARLQDRRGLPRATTYRKIRLPGGCAEITENDYNLNIPRYVDTFEEEEEIDLMAVRAERLKLRAEMDELEQRMEAYLREAGFA